MNTLQAYGLTLFVIFMVASIVAHVPFWRKLAARDYPGVRSWLVTTTLLDIGIFVSIVILATAGDA